MTLRLQTHTKYCLSTKKYVSGVFLLCSEHGLLKHISFNYFETCSEARKDSQKLKETLNPEELV